MSKNKAKDKKQDKSIVKINIKFYDKMGLINRVEEEVEALVFGKIEDGEFMLCQDEILRLANSFGVKFLDLVDCGNTLSEAFYPGKKYLDISDFKDNEGYYNFYKNVMRYHATYKVELESRFYFGSGSAGPDNIGDWRFKSYPYEIAHKRAKVNAVRSALGLLDYKVDFEDSDEKSAEKNEDEFLEKYKNSTPATEMQINSILTIIKRSFSSCDAEKFFNHFRVENIVNWNIISSRMSSNGESKALKCLTEEEAGKIIMELGDFSGNTER